MLSASYTAGIIAILTQEVFGLDYKKERVENGTVYWLIEWEGSSAFHLVKAIAKRHANLIKSNDELYFNEATFLKDDRIFNLVNDDLFGNLFIVEKQEYEPMAEKMLSTISKEMDKIKQGISPQEIIEELKKQTSEQELTFEQAIEFEKKKGLVGDEVYQEIIAASMKTSGIVDRVFGCERDENNPGNRANSGKLAFFKDKFPGLRRLLSFRRQRDCFR
jgi:hypothetical protein